MEGKKGRLGYLAAVPVKVLLAKSPQMVLRYVWKIVTDSCTIPHLTVSYLTLHDLISPLLTLRYVTSRYPTLRYLALPHVT